MQGNEWRSWWIKTAVWWCTRKECRQSGIMLSSLVFCRGVLPVVFSDVFLWLSVFHSLITLKLSNMLYETCRYFWRMHLLTTSSLIYFVFVVTNGTLYNVCAPSLPCCMSVRRCIFRWPRRGWFEVETLTSIVHYWKPSAHWQSVVARIASNLCLSVQHTDWWTRQDTASNSVVEAVLTH